MSMFTVNPKEDAMKDAFRQGTVRNTLGNFNSKKYYLKNKALSNLRKWALVLALLCYALFFTVSISMYVSENVAFDWGIFGVLLGTFSILISSAFFFISFSMQYSEHQKEEYDFYFDYYLNNPPNSINNSPDLAVPTVKVEFSESMTSKTTTTSSALLISLATLDTSNQLVATNVSELKKIANEPTENNEDKA
ncbi:hypothetical protein [Exiguobacterium sp. s141]|uniref:hypothetical protein n=1 Tax=Exiguobacterium sp. s141 TaxID=2751240 RepID=UPI001BE77B87|nr:hypothetical protein [Exiguobacterium sp. s141]